MDCTDTCARLDITARREGRKSVTEVERDWSNTKYKYLNHSNSILHLTGRLTEHQIHNNIINHVINFLLLLWN